MKTYSKIIALGAIAALAIVSCEETFEMDQLTVNEYEISRDSMEFVFIQTMNEIDENLEMIREKEGVIILGPESNVETKLNKKEKIIRNIQMINSLLEENRNKIDELNSKLKKSGKKNQDLIAATKKVDAKIKRHEERINELKTMLGEKEFELAELNARMGRLEIQKEKLTNLVKKLEEEKNTAYVAMGTFKELKSKGLVEKEGGVLWFGKTKSLNEDFDDEHFAQLNIQDSTVIPIPSKKVKLLSEHPSNSYEISDQGEELSYLEITTPNEFWKTSKHLLIEVK